MKQKPLYISISIPVKPHVKKYIEVKYGETHTLTTKSFLGLLLFNVLDKNAPVLDHDFKNFGDQYEIKISRQYLYENGYNVSTVKRKFLSVCLEKLFVEEFYQFVDIHVSSIRLSAAQSIRLFLEKYNLTENEINYETMYKKYQRYSNFNIKIKKNIAN
jgi:hypothetical protein